MTAELLPDNHCDQAGYPTDAEMLADMQDDPTFASLLNEENARAFAAALFAPPALPSEYALQLARRFYAESYVDEEGVRHFK